MSRTRRPKVLVPIWLFAIGLLSAPDADATFEGRNGRLAFVTPSQGLFTMAPEGSDLDRLTSRPGVAAPTWSPDGKRIAFLRTTRRRTGVRVIGREGSDRITISGPARGQLRSPAWSPDGRSLVYSDLVSRGRAAVKIAAADGSAERKLLGYRSANLYATWGPEGDDVVFASDRDGDFDIYLIRADGSGLRPVTDTDEDELRPQWSPDGERLLFERLADNGSELIVADAGGGNERVLTEGFDDRFASYSPDGSAVVFTRDSDVYTIPGDGGDETRLTSEVHVAGASAWAPDSTALAFAASGDIFTVGKNGSEQTRLTRTDERETAPDWQADPSPPPDPPPSGRTVRIAAAGDIACDPDDRGFNDGNGSGDRCHMRATSDLLVDGGYEAVLTLGDNQYPNGSLADFMDSYDPTWGRVKDITYPSAGNHEYGSAGPDGYFDYFGSVAGDRDRGYYSFDLGEWHLVALNSNCDFIGGCGEGSAQEEWLEEDLASHPADCTLAYWHHPRFSSGHDGDSDSMQAIWAELATEGVEVALVGHSHNYERFAPMDERGRRDEEGGLREFVVGTGGAFFTGFLEESPNSELFHNETFGILELRLRPASYEWRFVPEERESFTDSGSATCH